MNYSDFIDRDNGNLMPIFYNSEAFTSAINELSSDYEDKVDKVLGIEARGFILGGAVAFNLGVGFAAVRKQGALKGEKFQSKEFVDYSGKVKGLEIEKTAINSGDRILIVDDWFETGNQIKTVLELLSNSSCQIVGISVIYDQTSDELKGLLKQYNYKFLVSAP